MWHLGRRNKAAPRTWSGHPRRALATTASTPERCVLFIPLLWTTTRHEVHKVIPLAFTCLTNKSRNLERKNMVYVPYPYRRHKNVRGCLTWRWSWRVVRTLGEWTFSAFPISKPRILSNESLHSNDIFFSYRRRWFAIARRLQRGHQRKTVARNGAASLKAHDNRHADSDSVKAFFLFFNCEASPLENLVCRSLRPKPDWAVVL